MTHPPLELLDSTWLLAAKIVLLVAITEVSCRTLSRNAAAIRHLGWTLCCISLLAVLVATLAPPPWRIHAPHLATLSPSFGDADVASPPVNQIAQTLTGHTIASEPDLDNSAPTKTPRPVPARDRERGQEPASSALRDINNRMRVPHDDFARSNDRIAGWRQFLAAAWLCGTVILLFRHFCAHVAAFKLCHRAHPTANQRWSSAMDSLRTKLGITRPVRLLISNEVGVPITFGVWRPCVVFPRTSHRWDADRCHVAMLHELAHIKRFDTATQVLGHLVAAVVWWHPFAWFAAARQRSEQERASDETALIAGCLASDYAEHLLRIAEELSALRILPRASVAMIRSSSRLRNRLNEILSPHQRRALTLRAAIAPVLLATFIAAVTICIVPSATAQNKDGDSRDPTGRRQSAPFVNPPAPDDRNTNSASLSLPKHAVRRYGTIGVMPHLSNPKTAVSADGRLAATFDPNDTITLWDIAADRKIATLVCPPNPYRHEERLLFSPDGKKLLANIGVKFQMWDVARRQLMYEVPQERKFRVIAAAFSSDGAIVAGSSEDQDFVVHIWDTASGAELLTIPIPREYEMVTNLSISPDGNLIAVATHEGSIPIWDLAAGEQINVLRGGESTSTHSLIFSPDGRRLYIGGGRSVLYGTTPGQRWGRAFVEINAWDVETGQQALQFKPPEEWEGAARLGLSRDGKELYSLHGRRFAVWDAGTGSLKKVIDPERLGPPIGPSDKIITIQGDFSNLERYSIDSRDRLVTQNPVVRIDMAQLSDDGQRLLTAGNGSVHLWNATNGVPTHSLGGFVPGGHSVLAIAEVASKDLVIAVGNLVDRQQMSISNQVRAWDRYAGSLQYAVRIDGRGRNLAISPDGMQLAAIACKDPAEAANVFGPSSELVNGTIEVLDTETGNRVASLKGSFGDQMALQFSPTSDAIASIAGSTFRLWNIKSGDEERTFQMQRHTRISPPGSPSPGAALPTELYAAAIAPNLRWAATTGGRDTHVFVWNVTKGIKHTELIIPGMGTSTLAISPDSRLLAVSVRLSPDHDSTTKNSITVWDPKEGRQLLALEPDPSEWPAFISFSPDGKHLLSASGTSSAILWDLSQAYARLRK